MRVRSLIEQHLPEFSSSDTRIARLILERYPVSGPLAASRILRASRTSARPPSRAS